MSKYKTTITAKAELIKPNSETFKSIASSFKAKYGFDLKPQIDLMYMRSCLVSAGVRAGINENDDIFTREEAWAARHTPVLKPFNWQHVDKDIVGVIYSVEARDLNGNILDISSNKVPDKDFDLWTEAAIFRLIHAERAAEIENRAKSNQLFVSMEAWFDSYDYGVCDQVNPKLNKIIARDEKTGVLDEHLKVLGGSGRYNDPDVGQEMRIGRVLRSITYGGCGLVDNPANKRSVISDVSVMADIQEGDQISLLLQRIKELELTSSEENLMNTVGSNQVDVKAVVTEALDKRDQENAKAAQLKGLEDRAKAAEDKASDLQNQITKKDADIKALSDTIDSFNKAVDNLVSAQATAPEIAAIDKTKNGSDAYTAKLAWLNKSLSELKVRATVATKLEAELATAISIVRAQDVRALFANKLSSEAIELFVSHAQSLSDSEFETWRDQQELLVVELSADAAKKDPKAKKGGKMPPFMKKDEETEDCATANLFRTLLEQRRTEAGGDSMPQENAGDLVNPPQGADFKSGVGADKLRTPRFKIAGSVANDEVDSNLDNAQVEDTLNLAGASLAGDEDNQVNPFQALASELTGYGKKNEKKDN